MATAGTVAVLLPAAFYYLRETQLPPIELLRVHRVPIAIASDLNPGSAPIASLLLNMNLACTQFRLTPEEALARRHPPRRATALGLGANTARSSPERAADLVHLERTSIPPSSPRSSACVRPVTILRGGKVLVITLEQLNKRGTGKTIAMFRCTQMLLYAKDGRGEGDTQRIALERARASDSASPSPLVAFRWLEAHYEERGAQIPHGAPHQ